MRTKASLASEALEREVRIPVDGKLQSISVQELAFRALSAKAARGDLKALKQLLEWRGDNEPDTPEEIIEVTLVLEEDDT